MSSCLLLVAVCLYIKPNLPGGGGHNAPPPPQDLDHGWSDRLENWYRYIVTREEQDGGISLFILLLEFCLHN